MCPWRWLLTSSFQLYEEDAIVGHREFDLKLTQRVKMSMVGVPEMSFNFWAAYVPPPPFDFSSSGLTLNVGNSWEKVRIQANICAPPPMLTKTL